MNIKNPEAHLLAQELAAATGESLTTAVTVALRERLERVRKRPRRRATVEEILAIGRRMAARVKEKPLDHDTLLYDEYGLPK